MHALVGTRELNGKTESTTEFKIKRRQNDICFSLICLAHIFNYFESIPLRRSATLPQIATKNSNFGFNPVFDK